MGRLTPQEIEELRKEQSGVKEPVKTTDVGVPVESRDRTTGRGLPSMKWWGLPEKEYWPDPDDLPSLGEIWYTGERFAGLGLGTVMADTRKYPGAFRAFRDHASRGDWDAAIEAYQDELDMPKYYWGASEVIAPIILTGGLAGAGKGLMSAAPKLATTLGRFLPATRGGVRAIRGIETGLRGIGKGLRAPWQAEEAVARAALRGLTYPFRKGASLLGRRTGAEVGQQAVGDMPVEDVIKADEILGSPQPPELGFYAQIHRQRQNAIRALENEYTKAKERLLPWREQPLAQQKPRMREDIMRDREFVETFDERLASAKADERAAREAMETYSDPPDIQLSIRQTSRVDDLTRGKKPPKRATRAEAERGPSEINLDFMAGFEAAPKLGWWSGKVNALHEITKGLLGSKRRTAVEGVIETYKRVQKDIVSKAESAANIVRIFVRKGMQDNFKVDPETGHILDDALQNRVRIWFKDAEAVLQSPTIPDIAARYDVYARFLTAGQKVFIRAIRHILEDGTTWEVGGTKLSMPGYNRVLRENMPGFAPERIRPDITGNGFYITRGAVKIGNEVVTSIADELEKMVTLGKKRMPGKIAAEQRATMPVMGKLVDAQGKVIPHVDTKGRIIKYESFDKTMEDFIKGVANRVTGYRVKTRVKALAEKHIGTARIKKEIIEKGIIEGVEDADDALAAAINREFSRSLGEAAANLPVIRNINNMYRGIKANGDLSALSIQGHLAMTRAPKQWVQATNVIFKSLAATMKGGLPGGRARGQELVDEAMEVFNVDAVKNNRLVSRVWAYFGLRVGGTSVETALPGVERLLGQAGKGFRGRVAAGARGIGGAFQLSNRLYGAWGDVLRLRWADELLRQELAKGRTIQELADSGDLNQIANATNRLTGWSNKRFGGDIGELSMFAARFFQARLETFGRSLVGASQLRLPTWAALGAIGRTRVNVPFRGRPMIESDVLTSIGRKQTIENREALQSIIRMIGLSMFATEFANAMLGNETDHRPIVDGKINSNFYTVRMGGRDFSFFGPAIGLVRAIGTLGIGITEDPSPRGVAKAMAAASKGLGGGVVRLVWDNVTGYGFTGDPAPIGVFREDPEIGRVSDPRNLSEALDILQYVGELAIPIAPGAVGGELFEGVKSAREGDWGRVAGAGLASVGEVAGVRVTRITRKEEAEELSQEKYGVPYESLTYQVQDEIDDLLTERMGEDTYGGPKEYLHKRREKADDKLIERTQEISNEWLSGSPAGTGYHPPAARKLLNEAKAVHRRTNYGEQWSEEKGRMTGGILEQLYDRDEEKEVPEQGTREYRIWQYGQTFVDATDKQTGELDFDKLNKLQGRFWASLRYRFDPTTGRRVNEVDEMLESIRLMEGDYDPRMQYLVDAGRYAGSLRLNVKGETVGYYDLENHKKVEDYIVDRTKAHDVSRAAIRAYLKKGYEERKAARKSKQGERIGKVLAIASSEGGILWTLRDEFVKRAPEEWRLAMFEAGYRYQGKTGEKGYEYAMFKRIRAGTPHPRLDYKRLYRGTLIGQ